MIESILLRLHTRSLVLCLLLVLGLSVECYGNPPKRRFPTKVNHPTDTEISWKSQRLRRGDTLEGLFGEYWIDVLRFNRIDRRHAYWGIPIKVPVRLEDIKDFTPMPAYYPQAANDPKFILIDLSEQFVGAYEYGRLVFSAPVATGEKRNETPAGEFRITAFHRGHRSSLYFIEKTGILYPMNYGLLFHTDKRGVTYWIHGRDMPGYPASHGCVGLYDEAMQEKYYRFPKDPLLEDARLLFEWVIGPISDDGRFHRLKDGPRTLIVGEAP